MSRLQSGIMRFLKAAVALVATMMISVPIATHANFMNATTNSSLPYCNRTDDPVTTTGEVCDAIFDGLNELDDLCSQDGIVSWIPHSRVHINCISNFL